MPPSVEFAYDERACSTRQGVCEPEGFCSLPDPSCGGGRRFDETAGDGLAGQCLEGVSGCQIFATRYFDACLLPAPVSVSFIGTAYHYDTLGVLEETLLRHDGPGRPRLVDRLRPVCDPRGVAAELRPPGGSHAARDRHDAAGDQAVDDGMVMGVIDAGSHVGLEDGAGSNPVGCTPWGRAPPRSRRRAPVVAAAVGSGATGGTGGTTAGPVQGGSGGAIVPEPETPRGGCSGGDSAAGSARGGTRDAVLAREGARAAAPWSSPRSTR